MKKYFKIVVLSLSLITLLTNYVFAKPATARPSIFKVTAYKLEYCAGASTIASCLDPTVVGESTGGVVMDLSDASSAVSFGNASLLEVGKTYGFAQITLKRLFTVGGQIQTAGSLATLCTTGGTAGTEDAGGRTNGTTGNGQLMAAPDSTTNLNDINSVTAVGGTGTAGTIADNANFLQFRWALTENFTPKSGVIPTVSIAFDISSALTFNDGASGDGLCNGTDFYPGAPVITNTIK